MKQYLILSLMLFSLQIKAIDLILPEKFDVKVSKFWIVKNGNKINYNSGAKPIFHFNKNNFTIKSKEYINYGNVVEKIVTLGRGYISNRKIYGKIVEENIMTKNEKPYSKEVTEYKLRGTVKASGQFHVVATYSSTLECRQKMKKDENGYNKLDPAGVWKECPKYIKDDTQLIGMQVHYTLKLPVNQAQSSQVFIKDNIIKKDKSVKLEASNINDTQEATISETKKPLSATVSIKIPKVEKEVDPCKDPDFKDDPAWQQYCANKAYNDNLRAIEAAKEKKNEEEYQKKLKEYKEKLAKQKEEDAYWEKRNKEYFDNARKESLKRAKEAEKIESKAFHDSIAKDQAERKAVQSEIRKAHEIVDRFGGTIEEKLLAHKKIEELKSTKDINRAKKIKSAIKKQFYDSKQLKLQGEATVEIEKVKAWDSSIKRTEFIRDTSITANKILAVPLLAEVTVGAIAEEVAASKMATTTLPFIHGTLSNAAGAYGEDGLVGVGVSVLKDVADQFTFKTTGDFIDSIYRKEKYYRKGVKIPSNIKVYDENKKPVTLLKSTQRVYDKDGKDVTFSTFKKVTGYTPWIVKAHNDAKKADANKNIGVALDIWGLATSIFDK